MVRGVPGQLIIRLRDFGHFGLSQGAVVVAAVIAFQLIYYPNLAPFLRASTQTLGRHGGIVFKAIRDDDLLSAA